MLANGRSADNDGDHVRIRKLVSRAFSEASLQEQEPLIQEHIKAWLNQLASRTEKSPTNTIDFSYWSDILTFDILSDLTYGEPFGSIESGEWAGFTKQMMRGSKLNPAILASWDYAPLMWLLKAIFALPKTQALLEGDRVEQEGKLIRRRAKGSEARKDFMTYVCSPFCP